MDYRKAEKSEIRFLPEVPEDIISLLKKLMNKMDINWGAADFKKDEISGMYFFLEVNSNPMFSAFDKVCNGQISNSILSFLSD